MKGERELERLYGSAASSIVAALKSISLASFSNAEAERIQAQVRLIVASLNVGAEQWARTAIPAAYDIGARKAKAALEILGKKPKRFIADATAQRLVDDATERLIMRNGSIRDSVDDYLNIMLMGANRIRSAQIQEFSAEEAAGAFGEYATTAVVKEQSRGWLMARVREWIRANLVESALIEINGKFWQIRKYAKMVARTELRTAQTKATIDQCNKFDNDLVEVSDHGCDCTLCQEFEGNVYSISGRSMTYPILPAWTPFHPNCQHSILPTSEEAIAVRERYA